MSTDEARSDAILRLGRNRRLAHRTLFGHRHPQETPDFHYEIIDLWASAAPQVLIMAFRGAAKSTLAEESITLQACFREFHNGIILGETYARAVERLTAIKHEIETNPYIEELFGNLVGETWTEGKIVLSNGVIIQAFGRGQSLRGSKHLDHRPDVAFGDDIEDEESCASEEAIKKTMRWLMSVVKPALAPGARIRINGTPLHPKAVIMQLKDDRDWIVRVYPIEYKDENGERRATWPSRRSLEWIDSEYESYRRLGMGTEFNQEYMCVAEDASQKPFTSEMFRIEPTVRAWQAVYAMYDPARTVKTTSATTGVAVWSWLGNKMLVWDAYGHLWKPDEIISDIFRVENEYHPITIGVEQTGLHEFIMQPLRQEQLRRGYAIPVRALNAPKGKMDFIRGLQPFAKAGEIIFAKELTEARAQFLSFPTGRIDIPNALAYALRLRPGQPMYEGFNVQNIVEDLKPVDRLPVWLAVNGTALYTTGALLQIVDGALHVFSDWVREGDPGAMLSDIVASARLDAGRAPRVVAGLAHFSNHDTVGMRGAARKIPVELRRGGSELAGRDEIRSLLRRLIRGAPAVKVSTEARWTLNALSGGYAKEVEKSGMLTEFAVEGQYKTLMEGIEAFASLLKAANLDEDNPPNYAYTPDGRRYISALVKHG